MRGATCCCDIRGEKRSFPYLSAADVLSGAVPREALRDKIVFVGTTALGTREVVATPLDTLFAGVEGQATVADNLLQQDFLRRSPVGLCSTARRRWCWASVWPWWSTTAGVTGRRGSGGDRARRSVVELSVAALCQAGCSCRRFCRR